MTQEVALAVLFEMSVRLYCAGRIVTDPDLRAWRRRCLSLARQLAREIDQLRTLGVGIERDIVAMERLAAGCEAAATTARPEATVLGRARGDVRVRALAAQLARETKRLFGETLYRTIATIASVASGEQVTPAMVREAAKVAAWG